MIAPRYVGPSTTTTSPRSRNDRHTSSSASIAPLVISSSSSAGRRPCSDSIRSASASRGPASPRVGAYWNALASPASANSASSAAARSRGNVSGSGKPPAKEIRPGTPSNARISAIPAPTFPRVRAAKSVSEVTVIARSLLLHDGDHVRVRGEPHLQPQLRMHHLCVRVQRAEKRDLDLVAADLRHDDIRVEREKAEQPLQLIRVREFDAHCRDPLAFIQVCPCTGGSGHPCFAGFAAITCPASSASATLPWMTVEILYCPV